MVYKAQSVAYAILSYCDENKLDMSNLKLQKILYFIQAEFLVSKDCPCFEDAIEAWDFGPVVPSVYHNYKMFGGTSIFLNKQDPMIPFYQHIYGDDLKIIFSMVDKLDKYSSTELVQITQQQNPWKDNYIPRMQAKISNEDVKKFFK